MFDFSVLILILITFMKTRFPFTFLTLGLACALSLSQTLTAGLMHPDYDLQTYRDFAENRGKYAPDSTQVEIFFKDGKSAGILPRMMSFESVVDQGFAALTGHPQFLASVAHNGGYQEASFTKRFGGDDFYKVIKKNNGWGDKTNYQYDVQVARLDKLVTEAEAVPYMEDEAQLAKLEGKLVIRAGGGTQQVAVTNSEAKNIAGAYEFLTGGTVKFKKVIVVPPTPDEQHPASKYKAYQFQYNLTVDKDPSYPLPIGVLAGDSGSATWAYNEKTKRWEYIGPGQSGGGNGFSQMRGSNAWCVEVIKSYFDPTIKTQSGEPVIWKAPNEKGEGKLTQGSRSWDYHGLATGKKAAAATNDELEATRYLVFEGKPANIQLSAPIDMGAGVLTFQGAYKLTAGENPAFTLNCAGMDIKDKASVTSELTSAAGDEWRKVGKGVLKISGKGDNPVRLNIGEGSVILERENGKAADEVKLVSGRGQVILSNAAQLNAPVVFGVRGGVLDLNGTQATWDKIPHLDTGAEISNKKTNTQSTFTYTGDGAYLGKFSDDMATDKTGKSSTKGQLELVYQPTNPDATWTLQGDLNLSGGVQVKKGQLIIKGTPTLRANKFVDPADWRTAAFRSMGKPVSVEKGASVTLGDHSAVEAAFQMAPESKLSLLDKSLWKGKASFEKGATLRVATGEGAKNRILNIKEETKLIPVLPANADKSKVVILDLGKAPTIKLAAKMADLLILQPEADSAGGTWQKGATPDGMLRAVWTPTGAKN